MNILYIIHSTIMGGATISFLTMLKGITSKGYNAVVIVPDDNEKFAQLLKTIGVGCYVVNVPIFGYPSFKSLSDKVKLPYRLAKILHKNHIAEKSIKEVVIKEKINLIHSNTGVIRAGFNVAKNMSIPHVWHIREYGDLDFNIHEMPCRWYYKNLLRKSYVVTITKDLLKYNELGNCPKAQAIYNGVMSKDEATFNPQKDKYFLCASRISKEKGHHNIIKVFSIFHEKHPDYRLVVLGMGNKEYIENLKAIAGSCIKFIDFLGFHEDVRPFMAKAKALVVASPHEGFGRMTAEAAFKGCLVVGMNAAGTKEILDETGGFLFKNNDEMLVQFEIVAELTESEYAQRALYAQAKAIELYSNESYVQNVANLYEQVSKYC